MLLSANWIPPGRSYCIPCIWEEAVMRPDGASQSRREKRISAVTPPRMTFPPRIPINPDEKGILIVLSVKYPPPGVPLYSLPIWVALDLKMVMGFQ